MTSRTSTRRTDTGDRERPDSEGKLREGGALVSVHADERSRAKDIFKRAGAEDIASASESAPPKH